MERILVLNYEYPPLGGGAGNATYYLLKEYAKRRDIAVDLVTSAVGVMQSHERVGRNVTVHRLPIGKRGSLNATGAVELVRFAWAAYWYSRRQCQHHRYQVVHAFFGIPSGVVALLLHWEFRIPYIVSLRGADVPGYKARYKWLDRFLFWWLSRYFVWRNASAVVANSAALRALARQTAPSQTICVIPNGVDVRTFHPAPRRLASQTLTAGWTRLEARKRIDLLIEAMALLRSDYPRLRLLLLGTGEQEQILRKLVARYALEDHVEFLGLAGNTPKIRTQAAQALRRCQILCLPSENEGMSNAVLEGLASGLAVALTKTGGTEELLAEGKNGYCIPDRTPQAVASTLRKFLKAPAKLLAFQKASRQRAEQMSWANAADQYQKLYERVQVRQHKEQSGSHVLS